MKRLFAILILALALPALAGSPDDKWTGPDKKLHLGVSAILGFAAINQFPNEPVKAWALAMVPGVIKEASDPRWSWKDIVVDGVGAYLGVKLGGCIITPRGISYRTQFQ